MKTQIRSLLTLVCAATASLLIIGSPAQAGYIVTLQQVGPNVVATGSGAIDLTGLTFSSNGGPAVAIVTPSVGDIATGPTSVGSVSLYTGFSGPSNFGSGGQTFPNSGIGDYVGIDNSVSFPGLLVPLGYVSGTALSDSSTYDSATFSSLGVTPGTYKWAWGTGPNQNFALQIGPAHVPDSGSSLTLLCIVVLCWLGFDLTRRRVMKV